MTRRGQVSVTPHNLEIVSTESADQRNEIRVSPAVLDRMRELPTPIAASVANAILRISDAPGALRIRLTVPGDPPDTTYRALLPDDAEAPAIIFRAAFDDEGGKWLVTALMDRGAYRDYTGRLATDPFVHQWATAVAVGGTISADDFRNWPDSRRSGRR